jgi:hypothetical protein
VWVTASTTAAAREANTPVMCTALDALARLPADDDDDDKFANVGGRRGGGGGGDRGTGGRMIIDPRSVHAAINKEDVRDIKRCSAGGGNGMD